MRATLQGLFSFLHLLALAISPMAILMFVVGLIVLFDQFGERQRFITQLETTGQRAWAVVETGKASTVGVLVHFTDANGERRPGFIDPEPYPAAVHAALSAGAEVQVLYLPPVYETKVALVDHFDALRYDWQYLREALVMLVFSWVWIVFYPDFLYAGYIENLVALRLKPPQRPQ